MVSNVSPRRRRLSVEDRLEHLVGVGVELIATRHWDALTMNDIAAAADVSKPLLYHYFSTKSDLYVAAVRSAAEQLRQATRPDPTLAPRARLRRALQVHVDWVEANAPGYRTLLQGGAGADPQVQAIVERSRAEVVQRIVHNMELEQAPPALRIALRGWVGFLEGACLDWLTAKDITKPQLIRLLSKSLSGAIAAANVRAR